MTFANRQEFSEANGLCNQWSVVCFVEWKVKEKQTFKRRSFLEQLAAD